MDEDIILYRLVDPHPKYGTAGRSYTPEEWRSFPYLHKPLFERVNTGISDYTYSENITENGTEYYLLDY
jgi:hypothetical protein